MLGVTAEFDPDHAVAEMHKWAVGKKPI